MTILLKLWGLKSMELTAFDELEIKELELSLESHYNLLYTTIDQYTKMGDSYSQENMIDSVKGLIQSIPGNRIKFIKDFKNGAIGLLEFIQEVIRGILFLTRKIGEVLKRNLVIAMRGPHIEVYKKKADEFKKIGNFSNDKLLETINRMGIKTPAGGKPITPERQSVYTTLEALKHYKIANARKFKSLTLDGTADIDRMEVVDGVNSLTNLDPISLSVLIGEHSLVAANAIVSHKADAVPKILVLLKKFVEAHISVQQKVSEAELKSLEADLIANLHGYQEESENIHKTVGDQELSKLKYSNLFSSIYTAPWHRHKNPNSTFMLGGFVGGTLVFSVSQRPAINPESVLYKANIWTPMVGNAFKDNPGKQITAENVASAKDPLLWNYFSSKGTLRSKAPETYHLHGTKAGLVSKATNDPDEVKEGFKSVSRLINQLVTIVENSLKEDNYFEEMREKTLEEVNALIERIKKAKIEEEKQQIEADSVELRDKLSSGQDTSAMAERFSNLFCNKKKSGGKVDTTKTEDEIMLDIQEIIKWLHQINRKNTQVAMFRTLRSIDTMVTKIMPGV